MVIRSLARWWLPLVILVAGACGHSTQPGGDPPDGGGPVGGGRPSGCGQVVVEGPQGPPACTALPPPPSLPPSPGIASGTRLVPRVLVEPVPGGLEVPWGTHDTLLDVDCAPQRLADGTIRCLPSSDVVLPIVEPRFADAGHSIPVILEPLARPPARGALVVGTGLDSHRGPHDTLLGCGTSIVLWRIGAALDATEYYRGDVGPVPVPDGLGMFELQREPAELAELQEVRTQLSGAIARREFTGGDGSRLFTGSLYDTAHDVEVSVAALAHSAAKLLPPSLVAVPTANFKPTASCATAAIFPVVDDAGCDFTGVRFALAASGDILQLASTAGETIYRCEFLEELGECVYATKATYMGACAISPPSEWAELAPLTVGARITTGAWKLGDAAFVQPEQPEQGRHFSDTTLGTDCIARTAADGVLRCVPDEAVVAYADPGCTEPVVATLGADTPRYASQGSEPSYSFPDFQGQITVFGVGASRTGAAYYRTPELCSVLGSVRTFELGAEIAASTFAALEVRDAPPAR